MELHWSIDDLAKRLHSLLQPSLPLTLKPFLNHDFYQADYWRCCGDTRSTFFVLVNGSGSVIAVLSYDVIVLLILLIILVLFGLYRILKSLLSG